MKYTSLLSEVPNKYEILYIDPPWSYHNDSTVLPNISTNIGIRRPPYPVMGSKDIMKLPIPDISEDTAVMLIWTTDYHLGKCLKIINHWGYKYKTVGFAWQKTYKNGDPVTFSGAYTMKSGIENCLLATRGNFKSTEWTKDKTVRALVTTVREKHSKKPDEVRSRIEKLFGDRSRIELFAREEHDGWDCWGNQIG